MPGRLAAILSALVVGGVAGLVADVPARASNDPMFAAQYGPQMIQAPYAWAKSRGAGVTIAVVDSGVDLDHPDLKDHIVPGYDFADDDSNPDDDGPEDSAGGHGTHVAGIAAAITDNGIGIAGVAPDAKIMPLKVFPTSGNYNLVTGLTNISTAIRFAADNGAKVINLSLAEIFLDQATAGIGSIESSCQYAYTRGSLCVIAAGNEQQKSQEDPSGYSRDVKAIVVTANDKEGRHASFGSRADTAWSVTAPGVGIRSTLPNGTYGDNQGTSMAAPHVSGAAALLFGAGMSIDQVVQQLLATAKPLNNNPQLEGAGLVNVAAALGVTVPADTPEAETPSGGAGTAAARRATSRAPGSAGAVAGATATPDENADATAGLAATGGEDAPIPLAAPAVRRAASESDDGSAAPAIIIAAVLGLAIGVVAALRVRRRRAGPSPVRLY